MRIGPSGGTRNDVTPLTFVALSAFSGWIIGGRDVVARSARGWSTRSELIITSGFALKYLFPPSTQQHTAAGQIKSYVDILNGGFAFDDCPEIFCERPVRSTCRVGWQGTVTGLPGRIIIRQLPSVQAETKIEKKKIDGGACSCFSR